MGRVSEWKCDNRVVGGRREVSGGGASCSRWRCSVGGGECVVSVWKVKIVEKWWRYM